MLLETDPSTKNIADRHQASETESKPSLNREILVSWLFLIGSLIFTLDAVMEISHSITFSAILHISASILFTVGSVLFIPTK